MTRPHPLIGITGNFGEKGCELAEGYYLSVVKAGGTPVAIPPHNDKEALVTLLETLDGIIFSGGSDINPLLLGEEPLPQLHSVCPQRDEPELFLAREAFHRQIPMLGICRGIQVMAAALGGKVWQDIYVQGEGAKIKHSQDMPRFAASHTVNLTEGSLLQNTFGGKQTLAVNSFHHQAVSDPGPHMQVSALSPDGIIEAVESSEHKALLGVQWHPECFILNGDQSMMAIFRWLISEARTFSQAKYIHDTSIILDSHCDTPMFFTDNSKENIQMFGSRSNKVLVDLPKMREGRLDASIMVAYLPQGERTEEAFKAATEKANRLLTQMDEIVQANNDRVGFAETSDDILRLKAQGKKAILRGIENGYAIGKDIGLLEEFKHRGIVYMTLCHNGDNDICDSARGNAEHNGLSPFGREVVLQMNRLGILVDLSHASEKSFYDALELSKVPIVCSHSSARALCDHPRNLTDDQMRALAKAGGVAQTTVYSGFLRKDGQATIIDAIEHLCHAAKIMGVEHVGLGTDFDGDGGVPGLADASEIINFTRHLLRRQFSEQDIRLIMGGNFLRLIDQYHNGIAI
ncbi:MAG: gamma-glutamyl-gamma-aminobutyrate hydrolase family protein [Bacteroidaceae bacterium]|nr:gamma-glutamyl-gamma-aminobutyrate hydrolase family protein [Bacteroidaceae bacterium]MBQ9294306.1 gamma-glutamyl-gamma-aminobutyrate hydrolase family protein [Bacteroidaceae bacterium]